jgi:hypothetical protein
MHFKYIHNECVNTCLELTTFKMTFRDLIVVREIDVRTLPCGRRPF